MHYTVNFVGYWTISSIGVAGCPGIYCVCAGASTIMNRLLYIGESHHIESRIATHEKRLEWLRAANGHPLYFSVAAFSQVVDRRPPEAALIHYFKPPCNVEYIGHFPYPPMSITVKGPITYLNGQFPVP